MFLHSRAELKQLIYPHRIDRTKTLKASSNSQAKMVWIMFCSVILVISLGALFLAMAGLSFEASLIASIASFTNAGPAYSPEWVARGTQGWPPYSEMLIEQKMILSVIMIFGRLEVVALVAALNPFYWARR